MFPIILYNFVADWFFLRPGQQIPDPFPLNTKEIICNTINPLHSDPEAKSAQTTPRSATTSELNDNIAILTERLAERDQILESLNIKPLGTLSSK